MNNFTLPVSGGATSAHLLSATPDEKPAKKRWHLRLDDAYFATHHAAIRGNALKVYLTLKKMLGRNTSTWPRHSVIAKDAGVSVSTVKRALKELRDKGLVTWEHRTEETKRGKREQVSNRYFLAQIEPPPQSNLSESPRSKRATEQEAKEKIFKSEQTAPLAVVASSSKDESTTPLERELEALLISNATTRRRAADHPTETTEALKQVRKTMRKGGIRQNRAGYFMKTLDGILSAGSAPPPPLCAKPQQFVAPECSDASPIEFAPSEADVAMEREEKQLRGDLPTRSQEPVASPIWRALREAATTPVAPAPSVDRPARETVVAEAKEMFEKFKSEGAVRGMRQRLAPGYCAQEWETIVMEATR